ncbi:hypothetical protein GT94_09485 [Geobacillus stearothermophilus]|nr:hypothetical protein ET31_07335 [Geobacillus stearothermophilus]KFX34280.1 hypothetical protein GT94_09485 [Geobacillus stearothermophilus]
MPAEEDVPSRWGVFCFGGGAKPAAAEAGNGGRLGWRHDGAIQSRCPAGSRLRRRQLAHSAKTRGNGGFCFMQWRGFGQTTGERFVNKPAKWLRFRCELAIMYRMIVVHTFGI